MAKSEPLPENHPFPPSQYSLTIQDNANLLGIDKITFSTREELEQKLKLLVALLIDEGFVTSSVITDNGQITIKPGKINQVILKDPSTPFPELKKKAFGLDLENKIFNMKDLNHFVEKFNQSKSNQLKVSVENDKTPYYSNIILINDYHFTVTPYFQFEHYNPTKSRFKRPEKVKFSPTLLFEQFIGFNDQLSVNLSFDQEEKSGLINYSLPFNPFNINLSYSFQNKNIQLFDDVFLKDNAQSASFSVNYQQTTEPLFSFSHYAKLIFEKEKETLLNTLIFDRSHWQGEIGFNLQKYFLHKNKVYGLFFTPSINFIRTKQQERDDSLCMMSSNNFLFSSDYYEGILFLGYSRLLKGNVLYDKCFHSNKITDFNNLPLEYDTPFVSYLSHKLQYHFKIHQLQVSPFMELAIGRDFEYRKSLAGMSSGLTISIQKVTLGAKYSYTKDEQAITMKFNVQF